MDKKILIILLILSSFQNLIVSQSRWSNNYLEGEDPFGECIIESYDNGYLLAGRYGPNYPSFNWLLKTDVNGNVLWMKTLGEENSFLVTSLGLDQSDDGSVFLVGNTSHYSENNYDPIIMKLNSCGEKEWCKVFIEDDNNYADAIVITQDNGIVVLLRYMSTIPFTDRICLAKFNSSGSLQWKHCYNGLDTSVYNEDGRDITLTPDNGFLITGECDYESPIPPHAWWSKPYYIKVDSMGNFEWEKVVHGEITDKGGAAWNTVLSHDSNYYYSSISHYYHPPYGNAPALLKMGLDGAVIDIYDLAPIGDYGKMVQAKFITNTTLLASATWGEGGGPQAVVIDTLGNILHSNRLLENEWMANTEVTYDKKLLFLTNIHDQYDNFSTFLFKLNQQLESDTIYSQPFVYDSLCPYQIVDDTISPGNCGLIVGIKEIFPERNSSSLLKIFPNPTKHKFTIESNITSTFGTVVEIHDLYGVKINTYNLNAGQNRIEIDVSSWINGLYLVRVLHKSGIVENGKIIVQ